MIDWAYSGVNSSLVGSGGPICSSYMSLSRRLIETLFLLPMSVVMIQHGLRSISLPETPIHYSRDRGGKRLLLVLICLMWGIEIGFKFSSRTVIYLLNPCHVTTALQIYLLAAPPSKNVTFVFRIHLYFLNGAVLAFLFPVTDSRVLPCEYSIYWIQHSMLLVVPYYLLRLGGVYNVEKLSDMSWSILAYGMNLAYHFGILQLFAFPSQVNLNHMLCPAALDPFAGPYYRICAVLHQAFVCPAIAKGFVYLANYFLTQFGPTKFKDNLETEVVCERDKQNFIKNGHSTSSHDD